jgi:uncharacterized sulfatase
MIRFSPSVIAIFVLSIILAGCSDKNDTKVDNRPNILFCISDDQTWVHTSINGDPVVKTPNFDLIAREGLLFTNSFANAPSCSPSRAAILTGQNFWQLEEGGLLFGRLKKKFPIFTKILENAGYVVGKTGKGYGPANQEFDTAWKNPCGGIWSHLTMDLPYIDKLIEEKEGISDIDYAANFGAFLKAHDLSKPFFFWYISYEPHRDYIYGSGAQMGLDPQKVEVPSFLPDVEEVRQDICDYLFEIEWFDQHLGRMLRLLEENGELENTIIVVTSDNGMPFPRAKSTIYDYGVHMPLAIRWGEGIKNPGRIIDDFVNHIDFAPTFLDVAGLEVPGEMVGQSLMNIFQSNKSGIIDRSRFKTVTGIERHVWARPGGKTYPRRAIHTEKLVYIRNYEPKRWPMGGPEFEASHQGVFGDIDAGPTKSFMMAHQNDDPVKDLFAKSFGKLPAEELYDLQKDPAQINNLADNPDYEWLKENLRKEMEAYQIKTGDPRVLGKSPWDDYPFYAGKKYLKGQYLDEVNEKVN